MTQITTVVTRGVARSQDLESRMMRLRGMLFTHAGDHLRAVQDGERLAEVREHAIEGFRRADQVAQRAAELRRRLDEAGAVTPPERR
jgi:hypothetical protein